MRKRAFYAGKKNSIFYISINRTLLALHQMTLGMKVVVCVYNCKKRAKSPQCINK